MHRRLVVVCLAVLLTLMGCASAPAGTPAPIAVVTPPVSPPPAEPEPVPATPVPPPAQPDARDTKVQPDPKAQPPKQSTPPVQQAPKPVPTKPPVVPEPAKTEPRLAILVYHEVDNHYQSAFTVTPQHLDEQIRMLKAEGYTFYDLSMVEQLLNGGEGLPEKGVMLAFDDGYQSFVTQVLPLAEKHRVPAVCFVVTKYNSFDIIFGRPHMAPVEMKAAADSPWLDLAGHSYDGHRLGKTADGSMAPVLTQPIWNHLAPAVETQAEYEARVAQDFISTADVLKEYGITTGLRHFTFPYTARSDDAVRLGQAAGFQYFYVGGEALVTPGTDPTRIPRVHAGAPEITAEVLRGTLRSLFARP